MSAREQFHPTEEQTALAAVIGEALEALLPLQRLHERQAETDATWDALHALGVFGIRRPEAEGGSGLGIVEETLVALELGRRLASPAILATLSAAPPPNTRVGAGWREGAILVAVDEPGLAAVLIHAGDAVRLIDAPTAGALLDDSHWSVRLTRVDGDEAGATVPESPGRDRPGLIQAAALAGVATAALEMAVAFAGFREQFGRPIGAFQAVKHHCANMALAARAATDAVGFAAVALDDDSAEATALIDGALAVAGASAVRNAALNVQIHGGVGFSDEADPHLLVKRARVYVAMAGGLEAAISRIAGGGDARQALSA